MKKKMMLALCAMMAFGATSCAKEETPEEVAELVEEIAEEVPTQEEVSLDTFTLYNGGDDIVYTIDSTGNKVSEYRLADAKEFLKNEGFDIDNSGLYLGAGNGLLFYSFDNYSEESGETKTQLYALNLSTKVYSSFYTVEDRWSVSTLDAYKDKVYVDIYNYDTTQQRELVFSVDADAATLTEEASELETMLKGVDGKQLQRDRSENCFQRIYDKDGFILSIERIEDGDDIKFNYYKETKDGSEAIEELQNYPSYNDSYNKDWVLVYKYDDDKVFVEFKSLNDDKDVRIYKEGHTYYPLALSDDTFYYYETDDSEYGVSKYSIYSFDCQDGSSKFLCTAQYQPGFGNMMPGITGFVVLDGKVYAQQIFDNQIKWAVLKENMTDYSFEDINLPVKEFSAFDYGTVKYKSKTQDCPDCKTTLYKTYMEYFQLDSKYSEHADEINDRLVPTLIDTEEGNSAFDSECEDHKAYPEQYCVTDDTYVGPVAILSDRFLTIEYNGYWYGGGAHGMPSWYQQIFDLTTGELLGAEDFYSGTEEEFKEFVAGKIKEEFENEPEFSYRFFAADSQEAYQNAYDSVVLEGALIFWYEDHATYAFTPYDLGPYASGFITVDLPYSELLGTDTLAFPEAESEQE